MQAAVVNENMTSVSYHETPTPTFYTYGHPTVEVFFTLLVLVMVCAVIGNLLVIATILKNKRMRTRTNLLLCNLSLSDILVGSVDVPFAIIAIVNGDWVFSRALCNFNGYMVGLGVMLTIHTLMWISVHKYISIRNIFKQGLSLTQIFLMIVSAWAWTIFYNTLTLLGWTSYEFKKGSSQCGPDIPRTGLQISHSVVNKTCNFIIPLIVICCCYTRIFRDVRNHLSNLQDFSPAGMKITLLKHKKISSTLLTVVIVFFACYTPYVAYSASLVIVGEKAVPRICNPIAYFFMYLNSACNPIIYALKFPSFRKAFKAILCASKDMDKDSTFSPRTSFLSSFRRSLRRTRSSPNDDLHLVDAPRTKLTHLPKRTHTMPARAFRDKPSLQRTSPPAIDSESTSNVINHPIVISDFDESSSSHNGSYEEASYELRMDDQLEKTHMVHCLRKISISQPNLISSFEVQSLEEFVSSNHRLQVPHQDRSGSEGTIPDYKPTIVSSRTGSSHGVRNDRPWTMNLDHPTMRRPLSNVLDNRLSRMFSELKRSFTDLFSDSFEEDDGEEMSDTNYSSLGVDRSPPDTPEHSWRTVANNISDTA